MLLLFHHSQHFSAPTSRRLWHPCGKICGKRSGKSRNRNRVKGGVTVPVGLTNPDNLCQKSEKVYIIAKRVVIGDEVVAMNSMNEVMRMLRRARSCVPQGSRSENVPVRRMSHDGRKERPTPGISLNVKCG